MRYISLENIHWEFQNRVCQFINEVGPGPAPQSRYSWGQYYYKCHTVSTLQKHQTIKLISYNKSRLWSLLWQKIKYRLSVSHFWLPAMFGEIVHFYLVLSAFVLSSRIRGKYSIGKIESRVEETKTSLLNWSKHPTLFSSQFTSCILWSSWSICLYICVSVIK